MRPAGGEGQYPVPPFHTELVRGVATYGLKLFGEHPDPETIDVPIGCGSSGICGVIAARDAMGCRAEVVGVVSEKAQTAKPSYEAGRLVEATSAGTIADGMAVRVPVRAAQEICSRGAARSIAVSEDEIAHALRLHSRTIHSAAEGAGAAPLAAALRERRPLTSRKIGLTLSGGNVDASVFLKVPEGSTPTAE